MTESSPHGLLLPRYRSLMDPLSWKRFSTGMLLGVCAGAVQGLALLCVLPLAVTIGSSRTWGGLGFVQWIVLLGGLMLAEVVIGFFGTRVAYIGSLGLLDNIHTKLGNKVASLPLGWFRKDSGARLSRMVSQEMMMLSETAAHLLYQLVTRGSACTVVLIGSWFWDWRLGLLLALSVPLLLLFLALSRRALNHGKSIEEPAADEVAGRIVEFARCQGALRANNAAANHPDLHRALDNCDRKERTALWFEALGQMLSGGIVQTTVVALLVVVAAFAAGSTMDPLAAIATMGLGLRFTITLTDVVKSVSGLEVRRPLMDSVDEVMNAPELPVPVDGLVAQDSSVVLDEVEFSYEPSSPVLQGLSINVPPRTMCAVVGPSGSGKTTILRVVARFYDVSQGQVRVGGVDVRDMTTEDLMGQISMVFQDVYLFDDTLEANIRISRPEATDEEIRWAADLAGVTEIVDRLPGGWDTRVGEGGRALSGGERQRVSIARALLKKSPIVLFDEATSALDAENEANIVAAMEELRRHSTLIVVAHKLETIRAADQIVMLGEDGRLAQRGTHQELVAVPGPYQRFWNLRSQAVGWSLVGAE